MNVLTFVVFEEFQLVPCTMKPSSTLVKTIRDLYLPSVEMKTQSHSTTGLLTCLWLPHVSFFRQVIELQEKINGNYFVCGFNNDDVRP
jgi:hypothetical protein